MRRTAATTAALTFVVTLPSRPLSPPSAILLSLQRRFDGAMIIADWTRATQLPVPALHGWNTCGGDTAGGAAGGSASQCGSSWDRQLSICSAGLTWARGHRPQALLISIVIQYVNAIHVRCNPNST